MNIKLREYRQEDYKALENIIKETWQYERFCDSKTAQKLANVFLSSCLANATFSRVALCEDLPIGIILGKNIAKHRCTFMQRVRQIKALFSLYRTKAGRKAAAIFESVQGIDEQLLKESRTVYPAELALFAVDSAYRGYGIGKQLFQEVKSYMRQEGIDTFYLYTDTSCTYEFYEHQGMKRRCEKAKTFEIDHKYEKMTFFLYELSL